MPELDNVNFVIATDPSRGDGRLLFAECGNAAGPTRSPPVHLHSPTTASEPYNYRFSVYAAIASIARSSVLVGHYVALSTLHSQCTHVHTLTTRIEARRSFTHTHTHAHSHVTHVDNYLWPFNITHIPQHEPTCRAFSIHYSTFHFVSGLTIKPIRHDTDIVRTLLLLAPLQVPLVFADCHNPQSSAQHIL